MKKPTLMLSLVLFAAASHCCAQQHAIKPEAQAAFDQGSKLPFGDPSALEIYRKAIDLDPDFPKAQDMYITAYQHKAQLHLATDAEKTAAGKKAQSELTQYYEKAAKEHPKDAIYPWALGSLYEHADPPRSVEYFKQAIAADPDFAEAYASLGIASEAQGNLAQAHAYITKAHELWPDDVTIWRHYVASFTVSAQNSELELAKTA